MPRTQRKKPEENFPVACLWTNAAGIGLNHESTVELYVTNSDDTVINGEFTLNDININDLARFISALVWRYNRMVERANREIAEMEELKVLRIAE